MTTNITLDHLVAARALIANPRSWCQNQLARRDEDGNLQYCAMGALNFALCGSTLYAGSPEMGADSPAARLLTEVENMPRHPDHLDNSWACAKVAYYNNTHTHAEVLALFDRAIARQRLFTGMLEAKDREPQVKVTA